MDSLGEKIKLCSQALARINGPTISSFEDNTRESKICGLLYEELYNRAICSSHWSFSISVGILSADADYKNPVKAVNWPYRFILPSDCLMVLGVRVPDGVSNCMGVEYPYGNGWSGKLNGYSTMYELRDNYVYSSYSSVVLEYQYRVPEAQLVHCPLFREYVILLLASELAIPIMNDINKAQFFNRKAEDAYYLACSSDTNQSPTDNTSSSSTLARMRIFG